jgi:LysR family transcriptional regulator, nitrogen assimilation regulatory protein
MNYRQLRSFNAIARLGSFRRAAQRLRLSQPALTRQIHILEDELGVPLFVRKSDGVELTVSGEILVGHSDAMLKQLAAAKDDITSGIRKLCGNVAIGVPPALSTILFGPIAERVAASYPGIRLTLFEGVTYQLIEWLERGRIDMGVITDGRGGDFVMDHLVDEEVYLVGGGALRVPDSLTNLRELAEFPLILPAKGASTRTWLEEIMVSYSVQLHVLYRVESITLAKDLIARGLAFGIHGRSAVIKEIENGTLSAVCIPGLHIPRYLASLRDQAFTTAAGVIGQYVREEIANATHQGLFRRGNASYEDSIKSGVTGQRRIA